MKKTGIDVSKHQSAIDWKKVKADGVNFAILRAGFGKSITQKDPRFESNYKNAKEVGMQVGAYWYSYATTVEEAKQEAAVCLEVLKGKQFEYPIYFDLEEKSAFSTGKKNCSAMIRVFCDELEKAGYFAGLYMSRSPFTSYTEDDIRTRYALWLAEYNSKLNYSGDVGMWQKSKTGKINGIIGNVDLNVCYVDYPASIKSAGLNGFAKDAPEHPATKTVTELVQEVLDGKWGNGDDRRQRLTSVGYDYKAVQSAVNKLVSAPQRTHTVVSGDTLTTIARKYNTTVQAILKANRGTYPAMTADFIRVGWVLKV